MAPRWSKVVRDLVANRSRTLLVVLSIAVGVAAFGAILAGMTIMRDTLQTSYLATNPASAIITTEPFDDDLVAAVARLPGVAAAQGQRTVLARAQIGPNAWVDLQLFVLPDDGLMTINLVQPDQGQWPPPAHTLLIERASLAKIQAQPGSTLLVALPGGSSRQLPIVGLAHDLSLPPAPIAGRAFGYLCDGDPRYRVGRAGWAGRYRR
ncbi:MAG: ABC transporter permease [Oscillochloridaceae bacterium umkhey_bin13]